MAGAHFLILCLCWNARQWRLYGHDAWEWGWGLLLLTKASQSATLMEMVDKCSLGHPFQQWMIAFAQTTGFRYPTQQMLEMISAFSQSFLQSRINEQGNKHLRDSENRVNASKVNVLSFLMAGYHTHTHTHTHTHKMTIRYYPYPYPYPYFEAMKLPNGQGQVRMTWP